jgi:hypothetical protein
MVQKAGYLIYINSHLERLSDQVRTTPHSTDSKNLFEHRLPQRRELPGTNENTIEATNRPLQTDLLGQGPTGHVILLLNLKVASS